MLSREALKTTIAAIGPDQSHSDDHTRDRFAAIYRNDLGQRRPVDRCLFLDDTVVERRSMERLLSHCPFVLETQEGDCAGCNASYGK